MKKKFLVIIFIIILSLILSTTYYFYSQKNIIKNSNFSINFLQNNGLLVNSIEFKIDGYNRKMIYREIQAGSTKEVKKIIRILEIYEINDLIEKINKSKLINLLSDDDWGSIVPEQFSYSLSINLNNKKNDIVCGAPLHPVAAQTDCQKKIEIIHDELNYLLDVGLARTAIINYFNLLNEKKYIEALQYHGSGFKTLKNWNPNVNINQHITLLQRGCEENGWQCLKTLQVIKPTMISPNKIKFSVAFSNPDGTLFERGPCCDETELENSITEKAFEYIVIKKNKYDFVVETPPVYVP